jgi:hypothetical protein
LKATNNVTGSNASFASSRRSPDMKDREKASPNKNHPIQILWAYYGLLIVSRPVVLWNVVGVLVNALNIGAYFDFVRKEKAAHAQGAGGK